MIAGVVVALLLAAPPAPPAPAPAAPAPPAAAPAPVVVAPTAPQPWTDLLKALDEVDRNQKDDKQRAALAKIRKTLRAGSVDKPVPARDLVDIAEDLASRLPDSETVHLVTTGVLLQQVASVDDAPAVRARMRARAEGFVQRNPASTKAQDLLATVLMADGDEEGQLRALAACGDACKARFADAVKVWKRPRCTDDGIARGLILRVGKDVVAQAEDVDFLEPGSPPPAPPQTCTIQLRGDASQRLATRTADASAAQPVTLIVLHGVMLVDDPQLLAPVTGGVVRVPDVTCARLCKKPLPRALPENLIPLPPPPAAPTASPG
jgi:hypothetical protein